jgi:hypothetical protein
MSLVSHVIADKFHQHRVRLGYAVALLASGALFGGLTVYALLT